MNIFLKWLIITISILISAYLLPGVAISGFWTALWLAIILGLVNIFIKPILLIITLPINILTLGLFTFIINALLILLASWLVGGFNVNGFWNALLFSIILSVFISILNSFFKK